MRKIDLHKERVFENKKQTNKHVRKNQKKFYWATEIPNRKHNFKTYKKISKKKFWKLDVLMDRLQAFIQNIAKVTLG